MTRAEREYVETLERRIQALECGRSPRFTRGSLLVIPLLAVTLLTASAQRSEPTDVEARLAALESLIARGRDGSAQMVAPFHVLDRQGKILFSVGGRDAAGAVNVTRFGASEPATLRVLGNGGKDAAMVRVDSDGNGRITNFDATGSLVAAFNPVGLNVYNTEEVPIAGVTRGYGVGRVAVWKDTKLAAELTADPEGNGRVSAYTKGKLRAAMRAEGIGVYDGEEKSVVSILNRDGRGVVGVNASAGSRIVSEMTVDSGGGGIIRMKGADAKVAIGLYATRRIVALGNSQGATVAEMAVHPSGSGLFQIWAGGKMPLALLGKSADNFGGILQISNGQSIITSLTVSPDGNGMWQLNNATGTTVVEAGINGPVGTVRVGPLMRCIPRPSSLVLPDCILGRAQ